MKMSSFSENGTIIVEINNIRIDASNAQEFKEEVFHLIKNQDSIIDFKNLEFIDSSGLSALVYLHKQAANNNVDLKLANLSNKIMDIMKTTGLTQILQIYPDMESAKKDM